MEVSRTFSYMQGFKTFCCIFRFITDKKVLNTNLFIMSMYSCRTTKRIPFNIFFVFPTDYFKEDHRISKVVASEVYIQFKNSYQDEKSIVL